MSSKKIDPEALLKVEQDRQNILEQKKLNIKPVSDADLTTVIKGVAEQSNMMNRKVISDSDLALLEKFKLKSIVAPKTTEDERP